GVLEPLGVYAIRVCDGTAEKSLTNNARRLTPFRSHAANPATISRVSETWPPPGPQKPDGVGFSFPNVGICPTACTPMTSVIDTSVMHAIPLRPPSQPTLRLYAWVD